MNIPVFSLSLSETDRNMTLGKYAFPFWVTRILIHTRTQILKRVQSHERVSACGKQRLHMELM